MNSVLSGASSASLLLGFKVEFSRGGDLLLRRDHHDVAGLAHPEPLRLQDDLQGLVPRHVLQTQGDVARDGVARHQIEAGKIRDELKHGPDLDVLEIERELLAGVAELFLFEGLLLLLGEWLDFHGQDLIGLIG